MTAYKRVAKKDTAEDDSSMVMRELMTENMNNAPADPSADNAIVPLRPNRVSIIHEAIYDCEWRSQYISTTLDIYYSIQIRTIEPGTPAIE
jgi:hypothetical protein